VVFSIETTDTNTDTIRFRFEKHIDDYNAKRDHILRLSISLGVVYCEHECPYSIDELLLQADDLMFEQKKNKQKS
jgi:GGDEF domain-containing protein